MTSKRQKNPYNLKVKSEKGDEKGYLHEEIPSGYLTSDEFIDYLNMKKIDFVRDDNLARFCNNNNISMVKIKREGKFGATPYAYKQPTESQIQKIIESLKNNNNSFLGRKILKKKKDKILEIFDSAPSAADYDKRLKDALNKKLDSKKILEIQNEKRNKCYSKTSIAKKVAELLNVSCNRKLVASVLELKRSSQKDKLIKKD